MNKGLLKISLTGVTLSLLASCSEDSTTTSTVDEATFSSLYSNYLGSSNVNGGCAQGECHNGTGESGGPNFTTKDSFYTAITTKLMSELNWSNPPTGCDDFKAINGGSAETSVLAGAVIPLNDSSGYKFTGSGCTPSLSNHTEVHKTTISGAAATALVKWINDGALNN